MPTEENWRNRHNGFPVCFHNSGLKRMPVPLPSERNWPRSQVLAKASPCFMKHECHRQQNTWPIVSDELRERIERSGKNPDPIRNHFLHSNRVCQLSTDQQIYGCPSMLLPRAARVCGSRIGFGSKGAKCITCRFHGGSRRRFSTFASVERSAASGGASLALRTAQNLDAAMSLRLVCSDERRH